VAGIYIALGSNLGDRRANLQRALELMPPAIEVEVMSSIYETTPQAPAPPPAYYNAVCRVRTELRPEPLLAYLKQIEATMGRRPSPGVWAPRIIDLDLILYNDEVIETPALTVPHPRMREREFVLVPLAEIGVEAERRSRQMDGLKLVE
jgi:2-amino-4-hydroxy-6-hydroxymethyldihydropteridine diphosphokinase